MDKRPIRLLLVEDDEVDRWAFHRFVKKRGLDYEVVDAANVAEAKSLLGRSDFDIAVIDQKLPDGTGLDVQEAIKSGGENVPCVFVSGRSDLDVAVQAMHSGADDFLTKDTKGAYLEALPSVITSALRRARAESELSAYQGKLELLVAERTEQLVEQIEKSERLQTLLATVREVNELIVREKDVATLLQKTSEIMTRRRGYSYVWLLVLDEDRKEIAHLGVSGSGESTLAVSTAFSDADLPACVRAALDAGGQDLVVIDPECPPCGNCPMSESHAGTNRFSMALENAGTLFGVVTAALPEGLAVDEHERSLFVELVEDIAFALKSISQEKEIWSAKESYRAIVDNVDLGITVLEPGLEGVEVNRRMKEWFEGVDQSSGPLCSILGHELGQCCEECPAAKTFVDGLRHEATVTDRRNTPARVFRVATSPILGEDGTVVRVVEGRVGEKGAF